MKSKLFYFLIIYIFSKTSIYAQGSNEKLSSLLISSINQVENSPRMAGDLLFKINVVSTSKTKLQNNISWSPVKHISISGNAELGYEIKSFSIASGYYTSFASKKDSTNLKVVSMNVGYNYCPAVKSNTISLSSFTGKYSRLFAQLNYQIYKQKAMFLFGISGHAYDWQQITYASDSRKSIIESIISNDPLYALNGHFKFGIVYSKYTLELGLNYMIKESSTQIQYYRFNLTSGFTIDIN